jgi:hypothetical protein
MLVGISCFVKIVKQRVFLTKLFFSFKPLEAFWIAFRALFENREDTIVSREKV